MRIVCQSFLKVSTSKIGEIATLAKGVVQGQFVVDGVAIGGMNVPFRVMSTKRDGETEFGALWIAADAWMNYNGGKSTFGPYGEDDLPQGIKGLIDPDKVFELTDENDGFRLTIDVTDEGYVIVDKKHVGKSQVAEGTAKRLSKLSDKLAQGAMKRAEVNVQKTQKTPEQIKDDRRAARYLARNQ